MNTQRNGRAGQAQCGVDVVGRPIYSTGWAGVQCKDKDSQLGSELKIPDLVDECLKARNFIPHLNTFTVATTAPRDSNIQIYARRLNAMNTRPFDVHVWSWDDIAAEVLARPTLLNDFYQNFPAHSDVLTTNIAISAPKDQFKAFFSRPALSDSLGNGIKEAITQVAYELSDNAFVHGRAKHVQLSFDGSIFSIEDDGVEFNPLTQLDERKASALGYLGSWVLASFTKEFSGEIEINYARKKNDGRWKNILSIALSENAKKRGAPEVLDIPIDLSSSFGRCGADRYAESLVIPKGVSEVVLTISSSHNVSGTAGFIINIRNRIPSDVKLIVSHARGDRFGLLADYFKKYDVLFQSR